MTKWRIKRLPNVSEKVNFSWEQYDHDKGAKWDWNIIEAEVGKMEINEEKIIEIL